MTDEKKPNKIAMPEVSVVTEEEIREFLDKHLGAVWSEDRLAEAQVEREAQVGRMLEWQRTQGVAISRAVREVAVCVSLPAELFSDYERFALIYAVHLQNLGQLPEPLNLAKMAYVGYIQKLPDWALSSPTSLWVM